jgi:hypothetical protein
MSTVRHHPAPPEPGRFSIRLLRVLWIGMAAAALLPASAFADQPADDESGANTPVSDQLVEIRDPAVYRWAFGNAFNSIPRHRQYLDLLLKKKVATVDRICGLTDTQKRNLLLAGRGDIKRHFDRVEDIAAQFELVKNDLELKSELAAEARRPNLSRSTGLTVHDSIFLKILGRVLTAEQAAKFAPVWAVMHADGLVEMGRRGQQELLEAHLIGTEFADEGMAQLCKLAGLQFLALDRTKVTDAGLAHLNAVTSLRVLWLTDTQVTDAGLAHLEGLTELEWLRLDRTQVTGRGLVHLTGLTCLKDVSLNKSQVNDAGLEQLGGLTSLEGLELEDTPVTDLGLTHLKDLVNLEGLGLSNTRVTDAGLAHLKALSKLRRLWVPNTQVTDAGVAELQAALPGLTVHR